MGGSARVTSAIDLSMAASDASASLAASGSKSRSLARLSGWEGRIFPVRRSLQPRAVPPAMDSSGMAAAVVRERGSNPHSRHLNVCPLRPRLAHRFQPYLAGRTSVQVSAPTPSKGWDTYFLFTLHLTAVNTSRCFTDVLIRPAPSSTSAATTLAGSLSRNCGARHARNLTGRKL